MSFLDSLEVNMGLSKRHKPEYREAARLQEEEDKREQKIKQAKIKSEKQKKEKDMLAEAKRRR